MSNLRLVVFACEDLKDVDAVGKNDPYCIISTDTGARLKTSCKKNAGRSCVWNEAFDIPGRTDQVTFTVKDKGFFSSTLIGENTINQKDIQNRTVIPIFKKGKPTGSLVLTIEGRGGAPASVNAPHQGPPSGGMAPPPPNMAGPNGPHGPPHGPPMGMQPGVMPMMQPPPSGPGYGYPAAAPPFGGPQPGYGMNPQDAYAMHKMGSKKGKKQAKKDAKKAFKKMKKLF